MELTFDVLIVSTGRVNLLEKCLDSIFLQKPKLLNMVLVLTHREDLETISFLERQKKNRSIKSIVVDVFPSPGASRNILIKESSANYIQFLDDDAYLPSQYYSKVLERLKKTNCIILGGPDRSPLDGDNFQKTFELALENKFVMGSTWERHSTKSGIVKMASEHQLTLCNLWINKKFIDEKNIYFNEDHKRCEENEFLKRISLIAQELVYDSNLYVYHQRRESWQDLIRIHFLSGFYRGVVSIEDLLQFRGIFVLPFIGGMVLLFGLIFNFELLALGFFLHAFPTLYFGLVYSYKLNDFKVVYYTFKIIWSIQVSFSLGIVFGFLKGLKNYVR